MTKCKKCNADTIKSGIVRGKPRFKCKECNYNFTIDDKRNSKGKPLHDKHIAIYLKSIGLKNNTIAKLLNVSRVSIGKWLSKDIKSDNNELIIRLIDNFNEQNIKDYLSKNPKSNFKWITAKIPAK